MVKSVFANSERHTLLLILMDHCQADLQDLVSFGSISQLNVNLLHGIPALPRHAPRWDSSELQVQGDKVGFRDMLDDLDQVDPELVERDVHAGWRKVSCSSKKERGIEGFSSWENKEALYRGE